MPRSGWHGSCEFGDRHAPCSQGKSHEHRTPALAPSDTVRGRRRRQRHRRSSPRLRPKPESGPIHPALGCRGQQPVHLCRQGHGLLGEAWARCRDRPRIGLGRRRTSDRRGPVRFRHASPSASILQAIKGLPTVALAACAYDATMGIGVLNDGPIKTPKDLEGRQLASTVTSGEYPFLPAFAENAGFDLEKVTRIQVDNKVRDRLLSEGKVDAISGYASSAMPTYIASGVKAHFMLFSDYGILNHGTAVLTQPKRLAEEPELCAAFVDGAMQGLKATMLDPAEAMKVFFKQVPEMALATLAHEQIRVGTGIMIYVGAREIIKTSGMGYMESKDYETMTDLVMKYLAREDDQRPEVAKMMTNRFVGGLKGSVSTCA